MITSTKVQLPNAGTELPSIFPNIGKLVFKVLVIPVKNLAFTPKLPINTTTVNKATSPSIMIYVFLLDFLANRITLIITSNANKAT